MSWNVLSVVAARYLRTSCPVAYWEYHQNQDEPSSLKPARALLAEYLQTLPQPVHVLGMV
ncbi:MAG: hypothetical protein ACUVRV_02435 [Cyanobacteriota bacterium]